MGSSGRGAAWLARLLGVQEVPSSNLGGPTKKSFYYDVSPSRLKSDGCRVSRMESCGTACQRKPLIRTASTGSEPRDSASRPSFNQAKAKIRSAAKCVTGSGEPPATG